MGIGSDVYSGKVASLQQMIADIRATNERQLVESQLRHGTEHAEHVQTRDTEVSLLMLS